MKIQTKTPKLLLFFCLFILVSSCRRDNDLVPITNLIEAETLNQEVIHPSDNLYSTEKMELGRLLFYDPILSGNKDVACASCHHPSLGYADGRRLSSGVNGIGLGNNRLHGDLVKRNAPTIINTAFNGMDENGNYNPDNAPMFWDNRSSGLEEQALLPILSKEEMRGENIAESDIINVVIDRLNDIPAYQSLFSDVFGNDNVNQENLVKAIACFQRSIVATNSRFDQYNNGDLSAMNNQEIQGMNTFNNTGCIECHSGPMFSDYELHTLSVPNSNLVEDQGATGNFDFRTPSLRNLNLTAPYMHNGAFGSLRDVLDFYNDISGNNGDSQNPDVADNEIDQDARRLRLNGRDINEIIMFLNTLNDDDFDKTIPESVPSGLSVGGAI